MKEFTPEQAAEFAMSHRAARMPNNCFAMGSHQLAAMLNAAQPDNTALLREARAMLIKHRPEYGAIGSRDIDVGNHQRDVDGLVARITKALEQNG